jgi:hypothetical protein
MHVKMSVKDKLELAAMKRAKKYFMTALHNNLSFFLPSRRISLFL